MGTPASSPLKDIYFDFDRYDLRADARDTLKADADWLKQNPAATVEIEGNCDERGTSEYNLALGAKRAQAAKDCIATLGVDPQRLSTISYGQEIPVCAEHNEDCWQKKPARSFRGDVIADELNWPVIVALDKRKFARAENRIKFSVKTSARGLALRHG